MKKNIKLLQFFKRFCTLPQILPSLMAELFGRTVFYLEYTIVAQAMRQFALLFSRLQLVQASLAQLQWWDTRLIDLNKPSIQFCRQCRQKVGDLQENR